MAISSPSSAQRLKQRQSQVERPAAELEHLVLDPVDVQHTEATRSAVDAEAPPRSELARPLLRYVKKRLDVNARR